MFLQNWQRIIQNDEQAEEHERISYIYGLGLVATDTTNEEYKQHRREREQARRLRHKKKIDTIKKRAYDKGYNKAKTQFLSSTEFKKIKKQIIENVTKKYNTKIENIKKNPKIKKQKSININKVKSISKQIAKYEQMIKQLGD